jgi:hypothetical protein
MSQHASRSSSHSTRVHLPHARGRAWWPTGADLEAMVGLTATIEPQADADLDNDRRGADSPTVLAARLSLLFR